jgi:hypothetical protein
VPSVLALGYALVAVGWAASAYRQYVLNIPSVVFATVVTGDPNRSVEIAYAASLATLMVCAALLLGLLVLAVRRPWHRRVSSRYVLAVDVLALLLLAADVLVIGGTWDNPYLRSRHLPGPEAYHGAAVGQLVATVIALIDLWRTRPFDPA